MKSKNICVVIPHYQNAFLIEKVLQGIQEFELPVIVVDDGSEELEREHLKTLEDKYKFVAVYRNQNGGKGAAVMDGLRKANEHHFDYAIQVDADGQHDLSQIPQFRELCTKYSGDLILAYPEYDESVPKGRLIGRQISKFWVIIETLSLQIRDPLIGYRAYPIKASVDLINYRKLGQRMDFDPEIAVRLVWKGLRVQSLKTKVIYPENGISNFRMIQDNLKISWMHTLLMMEWCVRWPWILWNTLRRS